MESVHGVDVSWMRGTHHKSKKDPRPRSHSRDAKDKPSVTAQKVNELEPETLQATPKSIPQRPGLTRNGSSEKVPKGSKSPSTSPSRRNSWLSSISSKFSSPSQSPSTAPPVPTATGTAPVGEVVPTGPQSPRGSVLPHSAKSSTDAPYTPAPPKSSQPGFLQNALRRLSSGAQLSTSAKLASNGLCQRKTLNVDHHRERCDIPELQPAKLRRVAFCVDVEIASGPRYIDEIDEEKKVKKEKKRMEKGEGAALKNPEAAKTEKEEAPSAKVQEDVPKEAEKDGPTTIEAAEENGEKDTTKKKEKKKRSEEERKARKEKKRRLAEANGTLPVEVLRADREENSADTPPGVRSPRTQASPTTDPVRIYRRCCQLRETPILKKLTEQLGAQSSSIGAPGVVSKLDLTGYWLQLPDLITLGDYLAVVPVKELIMENCGLTDEGVRVILAGLLAAKTPSLGRKLKTAKAGEVRQGGVVERVVFKNNVNIGREGWRHICLFINMCRSLKFLDLSKVPFPQAAAKSATSPGVGLLSPMPTPMITNGLTSDISCLLSRSIGGRLAGDEFELLNVAECGLSTEQLSDLIDGVIKSGLRRLGVAGNHIDSNGMKHVARFIRDGKCEGLDLGGNDLREQLAVIAEALSDDSALYALSLADCNLTPDSLWTLFPALVKLLNFRFIDLSQNHSLFETSPSALSLIRRYLPKMPILKRIHLTDVSMTPEQAIALAEIIPDTPSLAHVNLMENSKLAALANAKDEASQEEACALYASLMSAVKVSKTIICIDIEVPSPESSEIVKALAKQVVAYCLWNMEQGPVAEISQAVAAISEPHGGEKEVAVPDVLLHLVGHIEDSPDAHDDSEPAPDEDYVLGGTGVVKALGICLRNRVNDSRRPSYDRRYSEVAELANGSASPIKPVSGGKAKQMSKNLLASARKIRARLQPALVKEARMDDRNNYQRLLFLDQTLEGMIKRFEDEFPDTRLEFSDPFPLPTPDAAQASPSDSIELSAGVDLQGSDNEHALADAFLSDDDDAVRPSLSRHNSDVSLASRALAEEEGRMHRFGQSLRRDILKPDSEDRTPKTPTTSSSRETRPLHLKLLRAVFDGLGGEELRNKINVEGEDAVLAELSNERSALRQELMEQDPEAWRRFADSQETAARNLSVAGLERDYSAIE